MRTKTVFTEVEGLLCRNNMRDVSPLALELHVRAVSRSVRTSNPAFVSDSALDAIAPGHVTTMAAIELCLAGVWHRADHGYGGYVITDQELIDHFADMPVLRGLKSALRRMWRELNSERFIPL